MRKYVLLFVAFAITFASQTSAIITFQKTYGGVDNEEGYSVQQTSDGGYIITGTTWSQATYKKNILLIKTDANGDTLWTRTFGKGDNNSGNFVRQTNDGGYIIAGWAYYDSSYESDILLIKTDSNGDTSWVKTFGVSGDDEAYCVQQTTDHGYIIAGWTEYGYGIDDIWLIKTDSLGDTLWTKIFSAGPNEEEGRSVQQTLDGGYIITGTKHTNDIWLIKTNASGDTVWTRTYGGSGDEEGFSVQQTSDSGYIIGGYTDSYGAGSNDAYLIKTNLSGDTLWTRAFGGASEDDLCTVQQTYDGGYIMTGYIAHIAWLIKTDAKGDTLWAKTFLETTGSEGRSVQQTLDGGYIIAGIADENAGDVLLIKTDSLGNVGIEEAEAGSKMQEARIKISQNPFIQSTVISYQLSMKGKVLLTVCDISGRCVKTLVDGEKGAGSYDVNLDAQNLKAGVYFVRLEAGEYKETSKLILMK